VTRLATALAAALEANAAASALASAIEGSLGGPSAVAGAFVLSTAAAGVTGEAVGKRLAARWPEAELVGTSFEGLVFEGRVWQGEPAVAVLAWTAGPDAPQPIVCEGSEQDPEALGKEIFALRAAPGGGDDVVLLFPDALGVPALEALLERFDPASEGPWLAGAAAVGVDEGAAHAWVRPADAGRGGEMLVGLRFPGGQRAPAAGSAKGERSTPVRVVGATRLASPWLEITACRSHWIDALEGEPPVDWIRRQLGLADGARIEPHLDRLLVRLGAPDPEGAELDPIVFEERFLTGVDARRGSVGVLGRFARKDRLALALPDPGWARDALRAAVDALPPTPLLLQLGCPGRGESLHGDRDLESALVAHQSAGRQTLGVLAPFQLGSDPSGAGRLLVYSTVLVAVGPSEEVGSPRDSDSN
jgi:hypothetical protein